MKSIIPIFFLGLSQLLAQDECLMLHLPMDGDSDDITENYVTQHVGPIVSDEGMNGDNNGSLRFEEFDKYIIINEHQAVVDSETFTIAVRSKLFGDAIGNGANLIFTQRNDNSSKFGTSVFSAIADTGGGNIRFHMRRHTTPIGQGVYLETPIMPYNEWHCYTFVYDESSTMRIYVDGIEMASETISQTGDFVTDIDYVQIGRHSFDGNSNRAFYNGLLDDFRIYDCALTPSQINRWCQDNPPTSIATVEDVFKNIAIYSSDSNTRIVFSKPFELKSIVIHDLVGQEIESIFLNRTVSSVALREEYLSGYYVVVVRDDRGIRSKKVFIE